MLFLIVFSLALSGAQGAPSTAVYKFVKCNPDGNQANCIVHQTAAMDWSEDLPTKLPASAAQYLEAEAVMDERDPEEEDLMEEEPVEEEPVEEEPVEEGESPLLSLYEDGSGVEGSGFIADWILNDNGSGELLDKNYKANKRGRKNRKWMDLAEEQKLATEEMKEYDLLHL